MNRPELASLEGLMDGFASISLSEMDGIRLMNRIDTKYLTSFSRLEALLDEALDCGYMVFEQNGMRIQEYDSVYFDTPALHRAQEGKTGEAENPNSPLFFIRSLLPRNQEQEQPLTHKEKEDSTHRRGLSLLYLR